MCVKAADTEPGWKHRSKCWTSRKELLSRVLAEMFGLWSPDPKDQYLPLIWWDSLVELLPYNTSYLGNWSRPGKFHSRRKFYEGTNKFRCQLFVYETDFLSRITENLGQLNNSSRKVEFGVIPLHRIMERLWFMFNNFFVITHIYTCFF